MLDEKRETDETNDTDLTIEQVTALNKRNGNGDLYNADPKCVHRLDPHCWSGIRCLKCSGWFCY